MLKRTTCLFGALLVGVIVTAALADEEIQEGKLYRLILTNNKEIVGAVTELEDAYKVQVASGITQTIKKSRVRSLVPLDDEGSHEGGHGGSLRHRITDEEIEVILGDESVKDLYVWEYVEKVDLMEPLDLDLESLAEMKLFAGRQGKWLDTDHFVCVYTSDHKAARQLVSRLEMVLRHPHERRRYSLFVERPIDPARGRAHQLSHRPLSVVVALSHGHRVLPVEPVHFGLPLYVLQSLLYGSGFLFGHPLGRVGDAAGQR